VKPHVDGLKISPIAMAEDRGSVDPEGSLKISSGCHWVLAAVQSDRERVMKVFVVAAVLLGFCLTAHAEPPRPDEPGKDDLATQSEWSLHRLVLTIDDIEWKGEWVPWILPSPFGPGPAILSSLVYNWQERTLTIEFLAYEKNESLKDHPAGETCQRIAQHVKSVFSTGPALNVLTNVLQGLPRPDTRSGPDEPSAEHGDEPRCTTIVKVTVQASPNDKQPYEAVSSCEISLPGDSDSSSERAAPGPAEMRFD